MNFKRKCQETKGPHHSDKEAKYYVDNRETITNREHDETQLEIM